MLTIQENPEYSIGILNNSSFVVLTMAVVNADDGRLIFKTDFKGTLSDFTIKYGDLIPSYVTLEVYLDLSVYVGNQYYHFATVTNEGDLVQQFVKLGNDYPYIFSTKEKAELTINLIEESTMKGILAETWDSYSLSSEELQSKIDVLEASLNLSTLKLKTYKTTAAELAVRGSEIPMTEMKVIKTSLTEVLNQLYIIQLNYDKLSDNVTLSTNDNRKYTAVKNIVRHSAAYYKLVTGDDFKYSRG